MRVLVTGGTGYLGRAIVSRRPRAVTTWWSTRARRRGAGCQAGWWTATSATGTRSPTPLGAARRSATPPRWSRCGGRELADFDDVNVGGLENVLRAATRQRIARIVYTSSFLALPPAGAAAPLARQPVPADQDGGRSRGPARNRRRRAARRALPRRRLRPGAADRRQPRGPDDLRPSRGPPSRNWSAPTACGRSPGSTRSPPDTWRPRARRARRPVPARRRERPAAAPLGVGPRADRATLPRAIPRWQAGLAAWAGERLARVVRAARRRSRAARSTMLDHDWPLDSGQAIGELGLPRRAARRTALHDIHSSSRRTMTRSDRSDGPSSRRRAARWCTWRWGRSRCCCAFLAWWQAALARGGGVPVQPVPAAAAGRAGGSTGRPTARAATRSGILIYPLVGAAADPRAAAPARPRGRRVGHPRRR